MARQNVALMAFNRGLASELAVARVDMEKAELLATEFNNWIPRVLGPMSLRPGLEAKYVSNNDGTKSVLFPFTYAIGDSRIIEIDATGAVYFSDGSSYISTTGYATYTIANSDFMLTTDWTDADELGATSTVVGDGYLRLTGTGAAYAIREQAVATTAGVMHTILLNVNYGTCSIIIGSASGAEDVLADVTLRPGAHALTFIPTGATSYIRLRSKEPYTARITTALAMPAGSLISMAAGFVEADLANIRLTQSGDVLFVACEGKHPLRIERRAYDSWSVVQYRSETGPFLSVNATDTRISASATTGSVTLTASRAVFTSDMVDGLIKLASYGQLIQTTMAANGDASGYIRVSGTGTQRAFTYDAQGAFVGNVDLQRSVGDIGAWTTVTASIAHNTPTALTDGFDNQIIYYRLWCSNAPNAAFTGYLSHAGGSKTGVCRISAVASSTSATADVVTPLGNTTATDVWSEGAWSAKRGFPSAVALHEGRLWWAGKDKLWASVVDDYVNFDEDYVGDAGPISRSIGVGPVDTIRWLASAQGLVVGAQAAEWVVRSTALGEPITPTNFNLRADSTRGSAAVQGIAVDHNLIFVERTSTRVMALSPSPSGSGYQGVDLAALYPEAGATGVVRTAVQRTPDTRIHFVKTDGTVAICTLDPVEDVRCWTTLSTDGVIEDVVVLPHTAAEDEVYYLVARTRGALTYRYVEKLAQQSECVGGLLNKQADHFVTYSGAATTTVAFGAEWNNASVIVWADGEDLGAFTVDALGDVTLPSAKSNIVVGLPYTATWQSMKLAHAAQGGTALVQPKRVDHLGLILKDTHYQGLEYGSDFTNMDNLPLIERGTSAAGVHATYDADSVEVNGTISTDSRLCLRATAPRPCTVLAVVMSLTTHDKL